MKNIWLLIGALLLVVHSGLAQTPQSLTITSNASYSVPVVYTAQPFTLLGVPWPGASVTGMASIVVDVPSANCPTCPTCPTCPPTNVCPQCSSNGCPPGPINLTAISVTSPNVVLGFTWASTNYAFAELYRQDKWPGLPIAFALYPNTIFTDSTVQASTAYSYFSDAQTPFSWTPAATSNSPPILFTNIFIASGSAVSFAPYVADMDFNGGNADKETANSAGTAVVVNTSLMTNPPPTGVWQTQRVFNTGPAGYTFTNLPPGSTLTLRVIAAEIYWTIKGQRVFSIAVNGVTVDSGIDLVLRAGGPLKGIELDYSVVVPSNGVIQVTFTSQTNYAAVNTIGLTQ